MKKLRWSPKTREEHNAYQNGRNRARADYFARLMRIIGIAKSFREKAREGFGGAQCDKCQFWRRGGTACRWGYCEQDNAMAPELGGCWAETDAHEGAAIITQEKFACINFVRRP